MKLSVRMRLAAKSLTDRNIIVACVYGMLLSYFYNLPVMTYSAKGSNELRLYDVVGFVTVVMYVRNYALVNGMIRAKKIFYRLLLFLQWATFMYLVTVVFSIMEGKYFYIMQSLLYLYHFWVFFLASVFLAYVIQDLDHLRRITIAALGLTLMVCLIAILQNLGMIPFLWNKTYKANYYGFLSSTLGPNKIVLGMTCLIMFVYAMGLLNDKRVKINRFLLMSTLGLAALTLVMSGSRTSYLGLAVFLAYFLFRETKSFLYSGVVICILFLGILVINSRVVDKAVTVYENRVENKIRNPDELREVAVTDLYEDLGAGRKEISLHYLDLVGDNLFYVPFGRGFNNRLETSSSAHNMYLSVVYELGILGAVLYFRWLISYLFVRMPHFPHLRMALKGLTISMLVTLFFGEHLYIYRPLFGLLGLFLFIMVLLSAPIFILSHEDDPNV
jgi:hypothetical protein